MMKKLNNKGFTLIELLAVIVILSILVAVAVPAVTTYLAGAKKGSFSTNASYAIAAVRNDVILKGNSTSKKYTLDEINKLLDRKLTTSPYGSDYDVSSYIAVDYDSAGIAKFSICLIDEGGNGIFNSAEGASSTAVLETDVSETVVKNNLTSAAVCK